jgi:hypothetical protein
MRANTLDTNLYDKVCQWLATGRWFSPGTLVSSTNKTDRHDITEILLKVALNIITFKMDLCEHMKRICIYSSGHNYSYIVINKN